MVRDPPHRRGLGSSSSRVCVSTGRRLEDGPGKPLCGSRWRRLRSLGRALWWRRRRKRAQVRHLLLLGGRGGSFFGGRDRGLLLVWGDRVFEWSQYCKRAICFTDWRTRRRGQRSGIGGKGRRRKFWLCWRAGGRSLCSSTEVERGGGGGAFGGRGCKTSRRGGKGRDLSCRVVDERAGRGRGRGCSSRRLLLRTLGGLRSCSLSISVLFLFFACLGLLSRRLTRLLLLYLLFDSLTRGHIFHGCWSVGVCGGSRNGGLCAILFQRPLSASLRTPCSSCLRRSSGSCWSGQNRRDGPRRLALIWRKRRGGV
mmetsp:Transcript_51405/g.100927  ORF Transcript_51405/g.100927 Transcript_51405/m.100927 type:complete len:311 (-) Transcript_51405:151-1083(-)